MDRPIDKWITKTDACWLWSGPKQLPINDDGRRLRPRRAVWEAYVGRGNPQLAERPTCQRHDCVRPDHQPEYLRPMDDSSAWEDVYDFIERVRTMKEPDYLLDQTIIPGGLTVVGGEAKIGKSFLALDMMLALTTGKAIGTTWVPRPEPLCVLYIDLDGTIRGTATRAADFLTTRPAPALQQLGRWRHGSFRLRNRDEFAQLYATIEQHNVRVVFIDTLVKTYDGDENNSADMRAFLTLIDELRHDTGCAVVLIHHYRKRNDYQQQLPGPTPMDPQVLLRGSSALAGWYDQIVGCASGFVKLASGIEASHVVMRQGKNEALMWTRYELIEGPHGRVDEILYGTWSKENAEWHQPKRRHL